MNKQRAVEMLFSAERYLRCHPVMDYDACEILEDAALNMVARAEAMDDPFNVGKLNSYADKWATRLEAEALLNRDKSSSAIAFWGGEL